MDSENGLQGLLETIRSSLVDFTRTANEISAKDVGFLRSSNPKAGKQLDKSNARLLGLSRKLLRNAVSGTSLQAPELASADDLEDNWRGIVDVIDNLLEKTDLALDECTGVIKRNVAEPETQRTGKSDFRQGWAKRSAIPKPQAHFRNSPNNASGTVFKPLLREKPHAAVPLEESIAPNVDSTEDLQYKHPYEAEIKAYKYPESVYKKSDPIPFGPLSDSEAIFVDTLEGVQEMLVELKQAKEIAIDLEHHDRHSYIGLVSLMQISTRDKDWVVDTLKPWREDLQVLNEVFTDPSILKVFHGASMDIIWLQRDLGLYVVGLFDTFYASSELHYERRSLAFLLKKFADFEAQKQYQLADWRVRPLPKELYEYARSDTHFLLNIFDHVRNELIDESNISPDQQNLIEVVMEKSKQECLRKYEHFTYDAKDGTGQLGWYNMLIRTPALFSASQFAIFRTVHQWRDSVAREEDENLQAVMSNQTVFNIARAMPDELPKLYASIQPLSEFVKERIDELLQLVHKAKSDGARGPEMASVMAEHPLTLAHEQRKAERKRAFRDAHPEHSHADNTGALDTHREILDLGTLDAVLKKDSQFWGATWAPPPAAPTLAPQFALPMPPVVLETTAPAPDVQMEEPAAMSEAVATPAKQEESAEQNTIVLREGMRNRKRKADAPAAEEEEEGEELANALREVDDAEAAEAREAKRARKAAKKAEKAEKRAAKDAARQALAEEEPFDYTSAPSVLNAARNGAEPKREGARPYAKAMDAPKGLPRVKRELKGKTMTFKK